jgi:3'(2'), 5'-bisphosphate nucleotidase
MDDNLYNTQLIDELIAISKEAGEAILKVYHSDFDYQIKEDLSPLTKADKISHKIISNKLKELTPEIPILSEEDSNIPFDIRSKWEKYWLVDPLDGTKEFIKRNGEFTVNIALIEKHNPVLGIIHLPVYNETYWGSNIDGSYYSNEKIVKKKISVSSDDSSKIRILASRSHPSKHLDLFLRMIGNYKIINKGSSIKFCLIASGKADFYPRLGPTSEWDIAAGDAIVRFAGGFISDLDNKPLLYNKKESLLNSYFLVSKNKAEGKALLSRFKNIMNGIMN